MDVNSINNELNIDKISVASLIKKFNDLMSEINVCHDRTHQYDIINNVAEHIINKVLESYNNNCHLFKSIRTNNLKPLDIKMWMILIGYINKLILSNKQKIKMLDVAAGHGRDMIYAQELGYDITGTDNCDGFLEILRNLYLDGTLKTNNIKKGDMRYLDFPDCTFDVVRHNASLVHMPLIDKGYTVDLAISEAHRVLRPNGLLHVLVKKGDDDVLVVYDTGEGMGERVFQYFLPKTINKIIIRNGFKVIHISEEVEKRDNSIVDWIMIIAQKVYLT
jgi:ubiquinone/menaquinone biosynthesis C-methylase UbiE